MTFTHNYFILAIVCMIGGLAIAALSSHASYSWLVMLFRWVGIVIAVLGLLLVLAAIVVFLAGVFKSALGV